MLKSGERRSGEGKLSGSFSPISRSIRVRTRSRSSNGTLCDGRSKSFIRFSNLAARRRSRTAERLVNLIAVFCIVSWRVFWMTMLNRSTPNAVPQTAMTDTEIKLLDHLMKDRNGNSSGRKTLSHYVVKVARLGAYLARASDPPPGNIVIWRGLSRLTDIELGAMIGAKVVG